MANGDDVLVDANTFEVTGTIEPINMVDKIVCLAAGPGALWVATGNAGILRRFDITSQATSDPAGRIESSGEPRRATTPLIATC